MKSLLDRMFGENPDQQREREYREKWDGKLSSAERAIAAGEPQAMARTLHDISWIEGPKGMEQRIAKMKQTLAEHILAGNPTADGLYEVMVRFPEFEERAARALLQLDTVPFQHLVRVAIRVELPMEVRTMAIQRIAANPNEIEGGHLLESILRDERLQELRGGVEEALLHPDVPSEALLDAYVHARDNPPLRAKLREKLIERDIRMHVRQDQRGNFKLYYRDARGAEFGEARNPLRPDWLADVLNERGVASGEDMMDLLDHNWPKYIGI